MFKGYLKEKQEKTDQSVTLSGVEVTLQMVEVTVSTCRLRKDV